MAVERVNGIDGAVLLAGGVETDEIQTLTLAAGTDGGTFRAKYGDNDTGALAWNITAADLQVALRALHADLAACVVGLVGEVYTVTVPDRAASLLDIINDCTADGGVWEGGIVVARTQAGSAGETEVPISGWEGTKSVDADDASTNADDKFSNVTAGYKHFNGTVTCLWDSSRNDLDEPLEVEEGDKVTLRLYPDNVTGGYWNVPALVTEINMKSQKGASVGWTFQFKNRGAYSWVKVA